MFSPLRLPLAFSLLLWLPGFVAYGFAQQPDCSKFVVLDTESALSDTYYLRQSRRAFCQQTVRSRADATSVGLEFGIPVPVGEAILNLSVAGNYSNSNWDSWQQAFCDVQGDDTELRQKIATTRSIFGSASAAVVKACFQIPGLHGYITPRADRKSAVFTFGYQAYQNETAQASIATFKSGASLATCEDAETRTLLSEPLINRVTRVVSCQWNPDESLSVTINSDRGGLQLQLDPDPHHPPAPPPVETLVPVVEGDLKPPPPADPCGAEMVKRSDNQGRWNLALVKAASASAYSQHASGKFPASALIDGLWDNCRSWIAADNQPTGSVWIDLGAVYVVDTIALTNLKHPFTGSPAGDRYISKAVVLAGITRSDMRPTYASLPDGPLPVDPNLAGRKIWDVGGIRARYIQIDIQATVNNLPPRLDEVEIFGRSRVVRRR